MPHERIYADTADPTWHSAHPTDDAQAPDHRPGVYIQWHEHGAVSIATGDLALPPGGVTDLPIVDLTEHLGDPRDSDTVAVHDKLADAIRQAITTAYETGVAVPRHVWLDRQQTNQVIRVSRRARNTAYGADE